MSVRLVEPVSRMDRTFFDVGSDTKNHEMSFGHYTCPFCKERMRISSSDLERHFLRRDFTNLDRQSASAFDTLLPIESLAWSGFVDFHCLGCHAPIRIIYEH